MVIITTSLVCDNFFESSLSLFVFVFLFQSSLFLSLFFEIQNFMYETINDSNSNIEIDISLVESIP